MKLTHIYRQDESSRIVINAHKINHGEVPELTNNSSDFFFIKSSSGADIASKTIELVTKRLPAYLKCNPQDLQVLCPMKNGEAG